MTVSPRRQVAAHRILHVHMVRVEAELPCPPGSLGAELHCVVPETAPSPAGSGHGPDAGASRTPPTPDPAESGCSAVLCGAASGSTGGRSGTNLLSACQGNADPRNNLRVEGPKLEKTAT